MLEITLLAAQVQASDRTPAPEPTVATVSCRDKNGRFLLKCFPPGTVVKMDAPAPAAPPRCEAKERKRR